MNQVLISLNKINYMIDQNELFDNISGVVKLGDKIGLIGSNGSGKSTLLKIIAGNLNPIGGNIVKNKDLNIELVEQLDIIKTRSELSIFDYLASLSEQWWEILDEAKLVFGLDLPTEKMLNLLSGGEIMQLNLAFAFTKKADLYLLDEPTNHLDIIALNKLQNYIKKNSLTVIVISHDHQFIEDTCDQIWEINKKALTKFSGKLSSQKVYKQDVLDSIEGKYQSEKKNIQKLEESRIRESEKAEKGSTKIRKKFMDGSIDDWKYENSIEAGSRTTGKTNQKFSGLIKSSKEKAATLKNYTKQVVLAEIKASGENRRSLFEAKKVTLVVGKKNLISNVDLVIKYGDRIGLIGPNGSGKTSLVKAVIEPNLKDIFFKELENIKRYDLNIAHLNQRYELIDPTKTVLENILAYSITTSELQARHHLSNYQFFTNDDVNKPANKLNGGALARLAIAIITIKPIDLLILDEPTNNLDIDVIEQFSKGLNDFKGAIIVISHNLKFLESLKVDILLGIKNKSLNPIFINDADYSSKINEFFGL